MIFNPDPALGVAPISKIAIIASLSIIGVLIGGFIAAKSNKEFKIKKGTTKTYFFYFVGGILVMLFALLLGACPYRAALRLGCGDLVAGIGIVSMAMGIWVGCLILLKKTEGEDF